MSLKVPGIYHLSFTGLFHAYQGHGLNADIILRRAGRDRPLGRSSADTNEKATFLTEGEPKIPNHISHISFVKLQA